jgi:ATP-dependent helicase YprA (DUF1998 family)
MKLINLIKELEKLPKNKQVYIIYDGAPRMKANKVFLSKNGKIMITNTDEIIYDENHKEALQKLKINKDCVK